MAATKDIWVFAKAKVDNKGVLARIGHSSRLHGIRSAFNSKGSMGSKVLKGLGSAGRAAFNLIPIPVIGALLSQVEQAVEGKIRSWSHSRHNPGLSEDRRKMLSDVIDVKFALKELSVENLDRYRFKVEHSVKEMTSVGTNFSSKQTVADDALKPCDPQLELALKVAQAERRLEIFEREIGGLLVVMEASKIWAEKARQSIASYKNDVSVHFGKIAQTELDFINAAATPELKTAAMEQIKNRHASCGDFCFQHDNMTETNWDKFRAGSAAVVRTCQEPFSTESFLSFNQASFESADQRQNYIEKSKRDA